MNTANNLRSQYFSVIKQKPLNALLLMILLCLLPGIDLPQVFASLDTTALAKNCSAKNVVPAVDGTRRLALIVGVGQYKSEKIPDLPGPPEDARRIYQLRPGANGY
jgi:hypothetical protein